VQQITFLLIAITSPTTKMVGSATFLWDFKAQKYQISTNAQKKSKERSTISYVLF